jgi:hypothetical protein
VAATQTHEQTVSVADPARHRDRDLAALVGVAGPSTRRAGLVPGLAAAATALASAPHRQLDGDLAAALGARARELDRHVDGAARLIADEGLAHPLHDHGEGREVDAGLVGEAGPIRVGLMGRETIDARQW